MRFRRMKKCKAYLDGVILCDDCLQAALDNNKTLDEIKRLLVEENPDHKVEFRYK